jgi:putative heme iron utilization protein
VIVDAENPFGDSVIAAVVKHMNADHVDDSLLICRTLGGQPSARTARMVSFNPTHAMFSARIDGGDVDVKVPWSAPVTERAQVRQEIVGMYRAACAQAGITPRGEHE